VPRGTYHRRFLALHKNSSQIFWQSLIGGAIVRAVLYDWYNTLCIEQYVLNESYHINFIVSTLFLKIFEKIFITVQAPDGMAHFVLCKAKFVCCHCEAVLYAEAIHNKGTMAVLLRIEITPHTPSQK
jgi:hypothetical protein